MSDSLLSTFALRRGHFIYESGHHGDLWIDLDPLFTEPARTRNWARALIPYVVAWGAEFVCGPLTGGAFLGQLVALELGARFLHAERILAADGGVRYQIPFALRDSVSGRRFLVVDDAINAGSALSGTLEELDRGGARTVGIAALLSLGAAAESIARQRAIPFAALATLERGLWLPAECPLCTKGEELENVTSG